MRVFQGSHIIIVSQTKNTSLDNSCFLFCFPLTFCSRKAIWILHFLRTVKSIWIVCMTVYWGIPGNFYLWAAFFTEGGAKMLTGCIFLAAIYFIGCLGFLDYNMMRRRIFNPDQDTSAGYESQCLKKRCGCWVKWRMKSVSHFSPLILIAAKTLTFSCNCVLHNLIF